MIRLLALGMLLLISACVSSSTSNTQVNGVLTQLANTATGDLTSAAAVANAATPPDADGATCGAAALTVAAAMQKVLLVTAPPVAGAKPATIGAFTAAEIASLYQPGSPQYQWAVKTLVSGCAAKIIDVQQAANANLSIAGLIAAIPSVLPLAAVP